MNASITGKHGRWNNYTRTRWALALLTSLCLSQYVACAEPWDWQTNIVQPPQPPGPSYSIAVSGGSATANSFTFNITGSPAGSQWTVFSTSDWLDWSGPGGNVTLSASGTATFTDNNVAGVTHRFYVVAKYVNGTWYHSEAIGFIRKSVGPQTYGIFAHQLKKPVNTLLSVFLPMNLPDQTRITMDGFTEYTWNATTKHWSDNADFLTLSVGDGFAIYNPTASPLELTFIGKVAEGTLTHAVPLYGSLIGSMVPKAGGITSTLNYQANELDYLYLWAGTDWGQAYYYLDGDWYQALDDWTLSEPVVGVGEGICLVPESATSWTQTFHVSDYLWRVFL
jgi:hypothetical protein